MEGFGLGSACIRIEQIDTFSTKRRMPFPQVVLNILASSFALEVNSQCRLNIKFKLKCK